MKVLIAVFGKSGSGKDTLVNACSEKLGYHKIKRLTSRPMREGESQGNPYLFAQDIDLQMDIMTNEDNYLEVGVFNEWIYATHVDALEDEINIGAFDVGAVDMMTEALQEFTGMYKTKDYIIIPIYLLCQDKTRLIRQLTRETSPDIDEIVRRYASEKDDYKKIDFEYTTLFSDGTIDELTNILKKTVDNILER